MKEFPWMLSEREREVTASRRVLMNLESDFLLVHLPSPSPLSPWLIAGYRYVQLHYMTKCNGAYHNVPSYYTLPVPPNLDLG